MDTVVYETKNKPVYVIQFENNDKSWSDTSQPQFYSPKAAISHLQSLNVTGYPYRIVERRP